MHVKIEYNNLLINHPGSLQVASKYGQKAVDQLIELGTHPEIAEELLLNINEHGAEQVVGIIFADRVVSDVIVSTGEGGIERITDSSFASANDNNAEVPLPLLLGDIDSCEISM